MHGGTQFSPLAKLLFFLFPFLPPAHYPGVSHLTSSTLQRKSLKQRNTFPFQLQPEWQDHTHFLSLPPLPPTPTHCAPYSLLVLYHIDCLNHKPSSFCSRLSSFAINKSHRDRKGWGSEGHAGKDNIIWLRGWREVFGNILHFSNF